MGNIANDLEIHYAEYGVDPYKRKSGTYKEVVIHSINKQISPNDRLSLLVNNYNLGGDFYPGRKKQLYIIYTFNGQLHEETLDEGELLTIPKGFSASDNALQDSVGFGLFVLLRGISLGLSVVALSWGISRVVRAWRFDA